MNNILMLIASAIAGYIIGILLVLYVIIPAIDKYNDWKFRKEWFKKYRKQ